MGPTAIVTWTARRASVAGYARSREVGVATEMLLTKAEQVSREKGVCRRITLKESRSDGARGDSPSRLEHFADFVQLGRVCSQLFGGRGDQGPCLNDRYHCVQWGRRSRSSLS
jgi:hypothetical protein